MSVAFRRESDDEHKEPKFELPIPVGPNRVTERGLRMIEAEVARLEAIAAPDEIDLRHLRYWRTRLATAEPAPPFTGEEAALGARVAYRDGGVAHVVDIVGHDEAEPAAGRIAFSAPLARALIGTGAGDEVPFSGRFLMVDTVGAIP